MIHLRPHHALCMQFYVGNGYSDAFTKNMTEIIKSLEDGAELKIVQGEDDICRHCPNNVRGQCITAEKVERYDEVLSTKLHLPVDSFTQLSKQMQNALEKENLLSVVCPDCAWNALCCEIQTEKKEVAK